MAIVNKFTITSAADLAADIALISGTGADAAADTAYTFSIAPADGTSTLTLDAPLGDIALQAGSSLTIEGNGDVLDGANRFQGFAVVTGTVEIDDLTIANAVATGAAGGAGQNVDPNALFPGGGGGGGGGAGLGGGLFVGAGAAVTLSNVTFSGDRALGGPGGGGGTSSSAALYDGGSAYVGYGSGAGGAGGGRGGNGGNGAVYGNGVAGGFGGGGGGGAGGSAGLGGFGAGNGGAYYVFGGGGGGGGLGAGADIFVQQGGALIVGSGGLGAGTVSGGLGGAGGTSFFDGGKGVSGGAGQAFGSGLFIQGNQQIALTAGARQTTTIAGTIADQTGSGGTGVNAGSGSLLLNGSGTILLAAANSFTGGISLASGELDLAAAGAAGTGEIAFVGTDATLRVEAGDIPNNVIGGFAGGDTIDLKGIGLATSAVVDSVAHTLTLSGAGDVPVVLNLDLSEIFSSSTPFAIGDDGANGTLLTLRSDAPPALILPGPPGVHFGESKQIATLVPRQPGDGMILTQTAGAGSLSLVLAGGVEEVIYTAPGGTVRTIDTVSFSVTDTGNQGVATASVSVPLAPGPAAGDGTVVVGHNQSKDVTALLNSLIVPGFQSDKETISAVGGNAVLLNGGIVYTAPATGPDSFTYTVTDQSGETATGTVAVTVDPGPIARTGTLITGHTLSTPLTSLIGGLVTPGLPGDTETISAVSAVHGRTSQVGSAFFYNPTIAGPDTVTYTIRDQFGEAATGTIDVTVDPGPTAATGALSVAHNRIQDVTAFVNGLIAPGLPGDTDTITKVGGSATLSNGKIVYRAAASGVDRFTYTVTNQFGDAATGAVNITVDPGPVAKSGAFTVGHDQSKDVTAFVNSLIAPGLPDDTETVTVTGAHVTQSNGTITYAASSTGATDSFSYTATDQLGETASGTIDITVDPGPAAATGSLILGHNLTRDLTALVNGLIKPGLPGDLETITAVSGNAVLSNGKILHTAPAKGVDSFAYAVKDQFGDTAIGSVNIAVDPGPIAATGSLIVGHNQIQDVTARIATLITPGLPGDTETITAVTGNAVVSNGKVTYAAPAAGTDSFTYTVTDGAGDVVAGSVNVTVDPGPTATNVFGDTIPGASVNFTSAILAGDKAGLDGDTLTLTGVDTSQTLGKVNLVNGQLTYTATGSGLAHIPAGATVFDHFNYTVSDQLGETASATMLVRVTNFPNFIDGPAGGGATIQGTAGTDVIAAFGTGNTIVAHGGNDVINAGSGNATVFVDAGDTVVNLLGSRNLVEVSPGIPADGNSIVRGVIDSSTVVLGNGKNTIVMTGARNSAVVGDGNNNIAVTGSSASVFTGNGDNVISVNQSQSPGSSSVIVGSGSNSVTLGGQGNFVVLGAGTDTVNAATRDTITLKSTHLTLKGGKDAMVFVSSDSASIDDLSSGMTAKIGTGVGEIAISDLFRDATGTIDLTGGVGGFRDVAGVLAALASDGHGGTRLSLGAGSSIDFVNTSQSFLTATHFKIG